MVGDAGSDQRMSELKEDRPRPAEQHEPLGVDAVSDGESGCSAALVSPVLG
jgi:hypothetical protein